MFSLKKRFFYVGPFNEELMVSGDFEMWVRLAKSGRLGLLMSRLLFLPPTYDKQFSRLSGIISVSMRRRRKDF